MFRNTRSDRQDYSALGLAPPAPTWGYPLTVVGEEIRRAGAKRYINGQGFHAQTYGSMYSSRTRAELDSLLDGMAASGVNAISVMEMESWGLAPSGQLARRPVGMFNVGVVYAANITWAVGDRTTTLDTSGNTRVRRRYVCSTPGAGGSNATGPTGTGTAITPSGSTAKWDYEGVGYSGVNEQFFTGDGTSAGFDYFLDACGRRGIYVDIRFDKWEQVFQTLNGGYACNGRAGVSGGNLSFGRGVWPLDGTSGNVDMVTAMKSHLNQFLDRINSVNGRRYGDDHTIAEIDILNEQGVAYWYFNTASTSSPTANTFDYLCHAGSSMAGGSQSEPNAAIVAWWDAAWLAWYQAKYPGHTPNGDFPGRFDTLPCFAYTTLNAGAANNIAQRATYRSFTSGGDDYLKRVAEFLIDSEASFVSVLIAHIRSKSSHIKLHIGQHPWLFASTHALGDIVDTHAYGGATTSNGNPNTDTITAGGGNGVSWAGGTLTVVFSASPSRALLVGQGIRVTQTSGGSWTGIVTIATVFTTTTTNDSFTATGVPDPVTIAGTKVSATAELPAVDYAGGLFHAATAVNTASTRIHYRDPATPDVQSNLDLPGYVGQSGLGPLAQMLDNMHLGKPCHATEFSPGRGITTHPTKGAYTLSYVLLDLLQGGSGVYSFAWVNATVQTGAAEHSIPGDGERMLQTQIIGLLARYVTPFPSADIVYAQKSDYTTFYSKFNTTDTGVAHIFGQTYGYAENTLGGGSYWQAVLNKRLRFDYGNASAPGTQTYPNPPSNALWTHPELNNATTGLYFVWCGMGCHGYENAKAVFIEGRLPTDSVASSLPLSKLQFSTLDGKAWYGRIVWISLDGSDLGVGRSALYTWCYSREEVQQFRRLAVSGGVGYCEHLLNDFTALYSTGDAATQPGVVMRDGLRLQLAMPSDAQKASIIERYGTQREHPAFTASGWMTLLPTAPLLVLSNSGTPSEAPQGGEQGLDFSSPDNSGYLSLHSIGV